jgi:hypothetical protein
MRRADAERAKDILAEILYITIATVDDIGCPWTHPYTRLTTNI